MSVLLLHLLYDVPLLCRHLLLHLTAGLRYHPPDGAQNGKKADLQLRRRHAFFIGILQYFTLLHHCQYLVDHLCPKSSGV